MAIIDRGLNLSNPDVTAPEEYEEFREFYVRHKGYMLPAFEFWGEFRLDVLKRYRLQARQSVDPGVRKLPLAYTLAFLHLYSIMGYEDGILYEVRTSQMFGATRDQILETLAVAFLHAGPRGMRYVATSSRDFIRNFEDRLDVEKAFPDGWAPDADAFRSGLDFSNPELEPEELSRLRQWYMRYEGEIPGYVSLLADLNPALLKAYRQRFENSIRTALPKQMMPYLMVHFEVTRGRPDGIREGVLLAKGFGVSRAQVLDAISWGMLYGGPASVSVVDRAVGDVLRDWAQ